MPSPVPHWAGEREAVVRGMWVWHQRAAFESWLCLVLAGMMNAKRLERCLARGKHPTNVQTTARQQEMILTPPPLGPTHIGMTGECTEVWGTEEPTPPPPHPLQIDSFLS